MHKGNKVETRLDDIVYLKGLKLDFWSRVHASIDMRFKHIKGQ